MLRAAALTCPRQVRPAPRGGGPDLCNRTGRVRPAAGGRAVQAAQHARPHGTCLQPLGCMVQLDAGRMLCRYGKRNLGRKGLDIPEDLDSLLIRVSQSRCGLGQRTALSMAPACLRRPQALARSGPPANTAGACAQAGRGRRPAAGTDRTPGQRACWQRARGVHGRAACAPVHCWRTAQGLWHISPGWAGRQGAALAQLALLHWNVGHTRGLTACAACSGLTAVMITHVDLAERPRLVAQGAACSTVRPPRVTQWRA